MRKHGTRCFHIEQRSRLGNIVARKLYENVLFDTQNERDVYGPFGRSLSPTNVAAIAAAIKTVHPSRIVTASSSPNTSPSETARFTADSGLDVTAYHDDRVANWFDRGRLASIVGVLRTNGRPAYLQEPARFPFPSTDRADYFRLARENAKRVGAAAWCFHTDLGFNLGGARFSALLQSRREPEWAFVLAHQLLHLGLGHADRREGRDPRAWNLACEHAADNMLHLRNGLLPYHGNGCLHGRAIGLIEPGAQTLCQLARV